jgi:hypothetical protein
MRHGRGTVRVEAARPVDAKNAPTGLCKTADGFAQLPHASSSCPFRRTTNPNPLESLATDPQILRRRRFFKHLFGTLDDNGGDA